MQPLNALHMLHMQAVVHIPVIVRLMSCPEVLNRGVMTLAPSCLQEHVGLLRGLIMQFPEQYADMALLLDTDPELDFFNNVAHLQLHRRQRALQRLTRVCLPAFIRF